jgi:hypothetical protein
MTQRDNYVLEGGASNQVNASVSVSGQNFFLENRHQFHTSILLSNWILTNQQTSIWNLGSDAYLEYTSCYFKVVTLFISNLFRVRLPYLLLIRSYEKYFNVSWPNWASFREGRRVYSFVLSRTPQSTPMIYKNDFAMKNTRLFASIMCYH